MDEAVSAARAGPDLGQYFSSGRILGVSVATSLEQSVNSVAVSLPATAATFTQPPRTRLETSERKPETVAECYGRVFK